MSGTKLPAIIKDLKGVDKYGGNSKELDSFIDSVETHIVAYGLPVQHAGWVLGKEGEYSFEEAISTTEDDSTTQINPNARLMSFYQYVLYGAGTLFLQPFIHHYERVANI